MEVTYKATHKVSNIDFEEEDGGQAFIYAYHSETDKLTVFHINSDLLEHLANLYVESLK